MARLMRGTRAKAIRRGVYGDLSIRGRGYEVERRVRGRGQAARTVRRIVADPMRRAYRAAKRAWMGRAR